MAGTHGKEDEGKQQGSQSSQQGSQRFQGGQSTQGAQGSKGQGSQGMGSQGTRGQQGAEGSQRMQGGQSTQQHTDPVCGRNIEHGKTSHTSSYQGQNYQFCSEDCKQKFDRSPQQYARRTA